MVVYFDTKAVFNLCPDKKGVLTSRDSGRKYLTQNANEVILSAKKTDKAGIAAQLWYLRPVPDQVGMWTIHTFATKITKCLARKDDRLAFDAFPKKPDELEPYHMWYIENAETGWDFWNIQNVANESLRGGGPAQLDIVKGPLQPGITSTRKATATTSNVEFEKVVWDFQLIGPQSSVQTT
jgi:hypothetical protein